MRLRKIASYNETRGERPRSFNYNELQRNFGKEQVRAITGPVDYRGYLCFKFDLLHRAIIRLISNTTVFEINLENSENKIVVKNGWVKEFKRFET